jgi:hypothetical protein
VVVEDMGKQAAQDIYQQAATQVHQQAEQAAAQLLVGTALPA